MIHRILPQISHSPARSVLAVTSVLSEKVRGIYIAHKKAGTNFVEKVTGYEPDQEKRLAVTSLLKSNGMKWDATQKAWVADSSLSIPFEDVQKAIQGGNTSQPTPTVSPVGKTNSPYSIRIETLLKQWEEKLSSLLPSHVQEEGFFESLKIALIQAEKVGSVSNDQALYKAASHCAQLGLTPGPLNEMYFSSRDGQIESLLGYKGIISLARRVEPDIHVEAEVVRENDTFEYTLGTDPRATLVQSSSNNPGRMIKAYVLITFPTGLSRVTVIDEEHIAKRKSCSKGINAPSSPWNKFPREMWLKSAIREAFRFINLSYEGAEKPDVNDEMIEKFREMLRQELNSDDTKQ